MTTDLTSIPTSNFVEILTQAAFAYQTPSQERPSANTIVDALLAAEKAAKQQKLEYPFTPLLGQWRLCFATGTRKVRQRGGIILGKGYFWPKFIPAYISFSAETENLAQTPSPGEISNQLKLGAFLLKFTGLAKYLGKKNILAFDFTKIQISLFGRVIYHGNFRSQSQAENFFNQPVAKLPFFAFFLVTEDFIAARGRGGGLALWVKEK
ncbi:MAG TPA: hypothetical protein VK203_19865 [Nostocaceae cyanobacterium]|nr:hypothetical protein [Nostocaceae cyanobacterium]